MWQSFRQALREFGYAEGHGRVFLINRDGILFGPSSVVPSMRTCRSVAIDPKGGTFPIIGDRRITRLDCGRGALMLDNPEKTARLLAALKAAVPFKVELVPSLVTYLRAQHVAIADQTQHIVSNLSYAASAPIYAARRGSRGLSQPPGKEAEETTYGVRSNSRRTWLTETRLRG